ncbi:hypothetical protein [Streptomyces werraensis]|uniref:hypothetical protein n=1 Tax=Streptomyces werraensis TaxID=68284 RepID=UPI0034468625
MTVTRTNPAAGVQGDDRVMPGSPQDWHGYPFVWAWHVDAGLGRDFTEQRCLEAEQDLAPADAVYKTSSKDPVEPDTWITVDRLGEDSRQRVGEYGQALLAWAVELEEHAAGTRVQPLTDKQQDREEPEEVAAGPLAGRGVRLVKRPEQD